MGLSGECDFGTLRQKLHFCPKISGLLFVFLKVSPKFTVADPEGLGPLLVPGRGWLGLGHTNTHLRTHAQKFTQDRTLLCGASWRGVCGPQGRACSTMKGVARMLGSPGGRQSRGRGGYPPWSVRGEGIREMVLSSSPIVDTDPPAQSGQDGQCWGTGHPRTPPTSTLHSTYSDQRVGERWGLHEGGCKGTGVNSVPFQTHPGGGLSMN